MTRRWPVLATLVAIALALYANALPNGFVWDDHQTFRVNTAIRSVWTLHEVLQDGYRPVRYLSFALDWALWGDRPAGYHFLNALYHGITAFLVYLVLTRLSGRADVALAGALLFVVHPVHTESVAYVSGRRDILTTLFFLLAFLADDRHRQTGRTRWLGLGLASFALALGSKEMAVTLPAVIVLRDLLLSGRAVARRRIPTYLAYFAVAAGAAGWAMTHDASLQTEPHGGAAAVSLLTVARLWVHYVRLLILPVTLLADYSFDAFPLSRSLLEPRTLGALAGLAAIGAAALGCARRAPLVTLGLGWLFVTLLPVSQIVPFHELGAEHYLYLPSVGICLVGGLLVARLRERVGLPAAAAALCVVLVAFGARTVARNLDWRDDLSLWQATVETAPRCARARSNLGGALAARGDMERALVQFREAIRIKPDYVRARVNLARILTATGRPTEGMGELEEALQVARALPRSPISPGEILYLLDRLEEAVATLEAELATRTRSDSLLIGVARAHRRLGNPRAALAAWERYLERRPRDVNALAEAAAVAAAAGDRPRALELSAEAARRARMAAAPREVRP